MSISTTGSGPSRGGIFVPTIIGGLALWLDASDAATLFTGHLFLVPAVNDGDEVGGWQDKSGNASHVIQSNASFRPTLQTDAGSQINGRNIVRFDGVDNLLANATANWLSTATAGTVFAVYRLTAALQNSETIIASSDEAVGATNWDIRGYRSSTSTFAVILQQNASDTQDINIGDTVIVASTVYLGMWQSSGTAYAMRINGHAETITAAGGADNGDWLADTGSRDNFAIGARKAFTTSAYLKGDLAELLVYSTALSAGEIGLVERYLNNKWAAFFLMDGTDWNFDSGSAQSLTGYFA